MPHDDGSDRGSLVIADRVIERIAAHAAQEVKLVTEAGGAWGLAVRSFGLPKAAARIAGGRSRITVQVAGQWPDSARETAMTVRDHVQQRVSELTGMTVSAVDVHVADVVHVETPRRRVQ